MSDFYSILGVNRTADQEEIKRAYRKLASQHHPDRGGDTKKFQEIQSAYEILSDPDKRSQYDNPQPQGFPGGFHFSTNGFPPGFDELFAHFGDFGGMFGRRQQKNRNLNIQTTITLEEAFYGKDLIANLKLPSGKDQLLEVKIPPGIQNGVTLRLSNIGDDSVPNLPRGDIHLTINITPHSEFQRQGDDLIKTLNINCLEAIVGKIEKVKTIDGKILEVNISTGIQHDQILSLNGAGMPLMNNKNIRGRLLLQIKIIVPTNLSNVQKDIIKQLIS